MRAWTQTSKHAVPRSLCARGGCGGSSQLTFWVPRGVKLGGLQVAVGDIVALAGDEEDEGDLQLALLQALWQTASKAKMMQVSRDDLKRWAGTKHQTLRSTPPN